MATAVRSLLSHSRPAVLGRIAAAVSAALIIIVTSGSHPRGQGPVAGLALDFDGANDFVTFGLATGASGLNATSFTLEVWFKREGTGITTSTGTGGVTAAIPLLAKGRGEAENSNVDTNYFLGIDSTTNRLAVDFEEGAGQTSPGLNHPLVGATTLVNNTWYHAAATYNATTGELKLFLNGVQDGTVTLGANRAPRSDSIQHASVGSALTSAPTAAGFFDGVIDEARIWNVVRTPAEIAANKDAELTSGTGLIGRWGMNEASGTAVANSIAGRPNGTSSGTAPLAARVPGFPLPPDTTPPAAPGGVGAGIGNALVTLTWNAGGEADLAGYNVYRGTSSPVSTSGTPLNGGTLLTTPIFTDNTPTNGLTYVYAVTAVDASSNQSAGTETTATPNAFAGAGMQFNGSSQWVNVGAASGLAALGVQAFTIETWFKRTGAGTGTTTGTGGLPNAIPLVAKGMAESESPLNLNMNYFLGINAATGQLVADFEDKVNGGNHPVTGVTAIPVSTTAWHHAAATYDGQTWRLYLDGVLDQTLTLASPFTPEDTSIQPLTFATALDSSGDTGSNPQGFFAGLLDEVRIWDHVRSAAEIQSVMTQEVTSAPGLIGRFGLNEAAGSAVANSARPFNGTAVGTPRWTAGYQFPLDTAPPSPPAGLTGTPGNNQVSLAWTANTEPDLAGYNVFRRLPAGSFGAPLNGGTLVTSPAYVDTTAVNETTYVYAVTARDAFTNTSGLSNEVTVTPSSNLPPQVSAGPDRAVPINVAAVLSGSASDDGPPAGLTVAWTQQSGPGVAAIAAPAAAATTATFSQAGAYTLRLTATDGTHTVFDEMAVAVSDAVLVGAGDIAPQCPAAGGTGNLADALATSTLLDGIPGSVFTLGDNAYVNGTASEFANCYDPAWGRHKPRTRPVSGNHDYNTPNATPYYDYFNGVGVQNGPAGDRTQGGYYSYNIGSWHVVVLNSECTTLWNTNGCAAGSAQEQWLRADLAASPTNNIIAMWHRPIYSSSSSAATHAYLLPLYQALYDYGADLLLGGHWHNYERVAPLNPAGAIDTAFGIRSFVIGTGGIPLTSFGTTITGSEVRSNTAHGVMKFTLHDSSYDWQFIPIPGDTLNDSGTAAVHGPPSGNLPPVVDAGPDQSVSGAAALIGSVTDDGLPGPGSVTWSAISGPGTVVFGNPNAATTSAGFTANGTYVLQLLANDGQFVRADTATIVVSGTTGNLPPVVDAGANQAITLPASATLVATITDDGLPGPDTTTTWTRTSGPGTVTFADATAAATTATFSAPGTYVLRLTANDGALAGLDEVTIAVAPAIVNRALDLTGTDAYVTFGAAPGLGVSTLTVEAWFRRDGAGATAQTGSGGITGTPLVAKGRNETDGSTVDMNYFFGIDPTGRLVADFEDAATGANHPATGVAVIPIGPTWHHAAATYDGSTWRLYLDGVLDQTTAIGAFTPRSDSIQHAAIGSALNSSGTPNGFFDGPIDEVRLWNRALSLAEIQANANQQLSSGSGLVARWGLDDGTGTVVADSTPAPINGTVTGSGFAWVAGAPFDLVFNQPPQAPVLVAPANGATGQSLSPTLSVAVSDPDASPVNVTFFGRPAGAGPAADFTLVALPDTQHYSDNATRALTFNAQTQWIVNNKAALNIPFVTHMGDIVENIDAVPVEWTRANTALSLLDGQVPYGLAPGNHDMNSSGVASNFDALFPPTRYSGNAWYGGYLGQNLFGFADPIDRLNKNSFELFSAGGMDFVIIHLEYDMPNYAVDWANRVLAAHPTRRAIITTHLFLNASGTRPTTVLNRTAVGTPAATVWSNLVFPNCNVFLVLNGHYSGEARRTDLNACGQPVHQLVSDYQDRANGGDGWLRYMTFKPLANEIHVFTYSPTRNGGLGEYETDAGSQFVLSYAMQSTPFTAIATNTGVASGTTTATAWSGLLPATPYEWYASVSDGQATVNGPTWTFTTAAPSNTAPTIGDVTDRGIPEDGTTGAIAFTVGDAETAPGSLTVTATSSNQALVPDATLGLGGAGANRTVTVTPLANQHGATTITLSVSDGAVTSTDTFVVTVAPVNDPPVATDDTATTAEDTLAVIFATTLAADDTDVEGDALTVTAVGNPLHGAVTLVSGVVVFTPSANFHGAAGFDYTVSDGNLTATGHVAVTVTPAVDSPVVHVDAPNGGEQMVASPFLIRWSATEGDAAFASFSVEYSIDDGASYLPMAGCVALPGSERQCVWAAPVATATARIRVTGVDAASLQASDASDGAFEIAGGPQQVVVDRVVPAAIGATATVSWSYGAVGPVGAAAPTFTVELSRSGSGGPWTTLATRVRLVGSAGRFTWRVTGPPSTTAMVRVRADGGGPSAMTPMTIVRPRITVAAPDRRLRIGSAAVLRWTTNLASDETVRIDISRNGGRSWDRVASRVPAGAGEFRWVVSGPPTTAVTFRVSWASDAGVRDDSARTRITR